MRLEILFMLEILNSLALIIWPVGEIVITHYLSDSI